MADLDSTRRTPLHPGVDQQSWLGFEQRMQARRFDALIANARDALKAGNAALAEHAITEAREIRPAAVELIQLDVQLRALRPEGQGWRLLQRTAGALALLAAGVAMFIGLDALRIVREQLPVILPPTESESPLLRSTGRARPLDVPFAWGTEQARPSAEILSSPRDDSAARDEEVEPLVERPALRSAEAKPPTLLRTPVTSPATSAAAAGGEQQSTADSDSPAVQYSPPPLAITRMPPSSAAPAIPRSAPLVVSARADPPSPLKSAVEEQSRVADVLHRYARAYGALDVSAAREVWPGVDERALARAFESLASQSVSFDDCRIDVDGETANASCRGRASYVGKVGHREPRIEPRTWRFELRREGETWTIQNAEAQRTSG